MYRQRNNTKIQTDKHQTKTEIQFYWQALYFVNFYKSAKKSQTSTIVQEQSGFFGNMWCSLIHTECEQTVVEGNDHVFYGHNSQVHDVY